jgi:hypothetical protein
MPSSVPLLPNCVYVVIRLKIAESVNSLVGTTLLCHDKEPNVIFPIGGLVQPSETLTTVAIRNFRNLANFRMEENVRLNIAKVLDGFMDHGPVKITILITNVLSGTLKWRARPHTPALVVVVTDSIYEVVVELEQLPGPIPLLGPLTSLTTETCEISYNFSFLSLG